MEKVMCTVENTKVADVVVGLFSGKEYTVTAVGTKYFLVIDESGDECQLYRCYHKPPEPFVLPPVGSVVEVLCQGEWCDYLVLAHVRNEFNVYGAYLSESNEGTRWRRK